MFLFLLFGCDEIDALFASVTDPEIAEGLVMGVRAPAELDLTDTPFENGGRAAAYLTTVDGTPIPADLALLSPANGRVALVDEGEGVWATPGDLDLAYVVGDTYVLHRDGAEILRAEAAPAVEMTLPAMHAAGTALRLDAAGQDFDGLLASVLDLETREEVWTNVPGDAEAIQAMLLEEPVLAFDIPAEAFAGAGAYAVGVAGLRANEAVDVTDVNALASLMATGVLVMSPVTVTE